jgi:hypothetical protein
MRSPSHASKLTTQIKINSASNAVNPGEVIESNINTSEMTATLNDELTETRKTRDTPARIAGNLEKYRLIISTPCHYNPANIAHGRELISMQAVSLGEPEYGPVKKTANLFQEFAATRLEHCASRKRDRHPINPDIRTLVR